MEKHESSYNMIDWWKKAVFYNYANFTGRARRSEYWYFVLFNIILLVPILIILSYGADHENDSVAMLGFSIFGIAFLGLLIPWLALVVRRLHDLNKSGWYYFVRFIPIVGPILLLVWLCTEGDRFRNRYGDDPKNPGIPDFDFEQKN